MTDIHSSWLAVLSDPVRLSLLAALVELGDATAAQLRSRSHASDPTLRRHLEGMEALGLLVAIPGESGACAPGRPPSSYRLTPRARRRASELLVVLSEPLVP